MRTPTTSPALRALVAGVVDYAGLFPPASQDMATAAAAYADYLASADAWMLGRFVVPVARLDELAAAAGPVTGIDPKPWRLSALVGSDAEGDARRIATFNETHPALFVVDAVEVRATTPERIAGLARTLADTPAVYVEVPLDPDPAPLLDAVRAARVRAKMRTGGVTADAIPPAAHVARFLVRCAERELAFKATAGLHHPLRAEHRLTYAADAPSAVMHGYLNVFVAAMLAERGATESELIAVLEERNASAFSFDASGLTWGPHRVPLGELAAARASFAIAFGSCSFREPVDDLQELALP